MNEVRQIKINMPDPQTNECEQEKTTAITALGRMGGGGWGVKGRRQLVQAVASILKAACGNERSTKARADGAAPYVFSSEVGGGRCGWWRWWRCGWATIAMIQKFISSRQALRHTVFPNCNEIVMRTRAAILLACDSHFLWLSQIVIVVNIFMLPWQRTFFRD